MAKKFLVNLDLAKNQILNAAIQNLSSAPSSPVQGQIYYNTMEYRMYFWDGFNWVDMSGDVRGVLGGQGLSSNEMNGTVTIDVNVDNVTIEVLGDFLRVKDNSITTDKIANLSTVLSSNSSMTAIPTAYAVKNYVDEVVGGIGNLEGGWDVQMNSSYPRFYDGRIIKKGDYWYATSTGTIMSISGNQTIEVGDVFVAKMDNAMQYEADQWLVLQVNKDQATESSLGLVRIADQITVNNGFDDTEAVTPLKLKTFLDANVGGYSTTIGDGFSNQFNISHNLGTTDVSVSIYEMSGLRAEVFTDIFITDNNMILVAFTEAPENSQYRVVIKK